MRISRISIFAATGVVVQNNCDKYAKNTLYRNILQKNTLRKYTLKKIRFSKIHFFQKINIFIVVVYKISIFAASVERGEAVRKKCDK